MRPWRKQTEPLDLTGDAYVRNAMELTQARRRLFNDLIGIREQRGISQAKVADAIGINRSGISRFEADIETSNPTFDVVLRYAHAVGAALTLRAEPMEARELHRLPEGGEEFVWRASMRPGALARRGFIPDDALAGPPPGAWVVDQEAASS
ncbi:helix-turn-helix domain-containing protein [Nocardia sp. NPDC056064]|uniref:helix-turn-helix domain-containing protein n=1 Tax=Nocardia sp. NPDC056064 TaxID=3345701 RepID=UPI0035DA6128